MAAKIVDRETFKADYLAGGEIKDLAFRYGCSENLLWALRQRLGLPKRPSKRGPRNGARGTPSAPPEIETKTARASAARACAGLLAALRAHHPLPVRRASPRFSIKVAA